MRRYTRWITVFAFSFVVALAAACATTPQLSGEGVTPRLGGLIVDGHTADTGEQHIVKIVEDGLENIATGDFYHPSVSYGVIDVDPKYKHVLNWQLTPMFPPRLENIASNGPLVLYSDDFDCLVFSSTEHFYATLISFENGQIHYGLHGDIERVPAGFHHGFILVAGHGVQHTIERWGFRLRAMQHAERRDRYADVGLSYLGYWTNNGAYYYYNSEPGMTEEEVLLRVKQDADARGIPYGYLQIDSWFYKKAGGIVTGGLLRWEPTADRFPHGLTYLHQKTGLPLIVHNRWFAKDNEYVDQYPFVFDRRMAMPVGRGVFDEFARNAKSWGVTTYEQDWLMNQFWGNRSLRRSVDATDRYMDNLAGAMADQGMTMQICMSGAAHVMDSVRHPNITSVRSSIDYAPNVSKESYWPQFHINNLIVYAVGIWPFKDNFRTSEDHGWAEALISSLSAGMVGPSDRLGEADADMLSRTCRVDGLLLKPDRPALPIDAMLLPNRRPFITETYSDRGALGRWRYLTAYHIARHHPQRAKLDKMWPYVSYDLQDPSDFFHFPDTVTDWHIDLAAELGVTEPVVVYNWRTKTARLHEGVYHFKPIADLYDFTHLILAPVLTNGLALLGETDKFVPLADKRFTKIEALHDAIAVTVAGVPGERVTLRWFDARSGRLYGPRTIVVNDEGFASAKLAR
ncbi:MAG: hypothetical protein P9L99_19670 [Candidatus Lernaella stagnicola]|nr:hypothetical protein [Candidatus Lernaella stagnicola]